MIERRSFLHEFVQSKKGQLIVQPRMGFSDLDKMRQGLQAVKDLNMPTVGTITLDSFTRTGDFDSALLAIRNGNQLNGYPIVSHGSESNRQLLDGLMEGDFPVQVRHGCSKPQTIFRALIKAGMDATEGGPISYCFPYGRIPLKESIEAWQASCELLAVAKGRSFHVESFGGCMMGQLCPPSMLIAITTIEALFFKTFGISSYSISLTQGANLEQDIAALKALRRIGEKYLGPQEEWHIVYYTFMGKFPETVQGARALMRDSVVAAKAGNAERLIVKTVKEAHQIPTIEDNTDALSYAHNDFKEPLATNLRHINPEMVQVIFEEADFLLDLLLNLDHQIVRAIKKAFEKGFWDIPFCLHPDNHNQVLARLDQEGIIRWSNAGKIPFPTHILNNNFSKEQQLNSYELFNMLSFNQVKYDSLSISSKSLTSKTLNF